MELPGGASSRLSAGSGVEQCHVAAQLLGYAGLGAWGGLEGLMGGVEQQTG